MSRSLVQRSALFSATSSSYLFWTLYSASDIRARNSRLQILQLSLEEKLCRLVDSNF